VAKLELTRRLSIPPGQAWAHVSDLSTLGEWLGLHQGGRPRRVRCTKYSLQMTVAPMDGGCEFTVTIDLGGRPLFGPIGAAAARAVKGDIERSIKRFEALYG
jgi:Polyketide cyclase / dehydrase and lipid transport